MTTVCSLHRSSSQSSDGDLLRAYRTHKSPEAFDNLVRRYLDFVYAACRREVHDPDLAQDVTQAVFLVLARKAHLLRSEAALPAWLLQTARLAAREALRKERRRVQYEHQAAQEQARRTQDAAVWEQIEPQLHAALCTLKQGERQILLLRFFEGRSLREAGAMLGLSEDAARMRVQRALDKMRRHFAATGVVLSASALASLLLENNAQAAPAHLLSAITGSYAASHSSLALSSARSHAYAQGTLRTMNMLKIKTMALPVLGIALTLGGLGWARSAGQRQNGAPAFLAQGLHLQPARPNPVAGASALPGTQLPAAFTLTYAATEQVTWSPIAAARLRASVRTSYARSVRSGDMTQAQADRSYQQSLERLTGTPALCHYLITVSARDGKLLCRSDPQDGDNAQEGSHAPGEPASVYLHDGQQSLRYFHGNPNASIFAGLNLWAAPHLPLPGLGMAGVPLLQQAPTQEAAHMRTEQATQAFANAAAPDKPEATVRRTGLVPSLHEVQGEQSTPNVIYRPGQITWRTRVGQPQVVQIQVGQGGRTKAQWDYVQHQRFAGLWLASQLRATDFDNEGRPLRVTEYHLVKASEVPLQAGQFDIATWLPASTTVSFFANQEERTFHYEAGRGDWQAQATP